MELQLGNHRLTFWQIVGEFKDGELTDTDIQEEITYWDSRHNGFHIERIFAVKYYIETTPFSNGNGRFVKAEFLAAFACHFNWTQQEAADKCYPIAMKSLQEIIDKIGETETLPIQVYPIPDLDKQ